MPDNNKKFYLVEGSALPEVFIRVTQARELLDTGRAQTVAEAAAMAGISRSAYYKYRDAVLPFRDLGRGHIVTFQLLLEDVAGMLSAVLALFSSHGANILTINQSIPSNGTAPVTITADTASLNVSTEALLSSISALDGIIKAAVLAG